MRRLLLGLTWMLALQGCVAVTDAACREDDNCPTGYVCGPAGRCVTGVTDAGGSTDSGTPPDAGMHEDAGAPDSGLSSDGGSVDAGSSDGGPFVELAVDSTACAVRADGTLWCWGSNGNGQLADGTTKDDGTPRQIVSDTPWAHVWTLNSTVVAQRTDGTLWGWGANPNGQLRAPGGLTDNVTSPVQIGTDKDWKSIAVGGAFICGLKTGGTLWCWGANNSGQLGDSHMTGQTSPEQIGLDTHWATVSAGTAHACAIKSNGTLWCWGANESGELGDGSTAQQSAPEQIGTDTNWILTGCGDQNTCALKSDGTLWCWGANDSGQLGIGSTASRSTPTQVGTDTDWTDLRVTWSDAAAKKRDGAWYTWGLNNDFQLGDGTSLNRLSPVAVDTQDGTPWLTLAGGEPVACGIKSNDGTLWCWGDNENGGLGIGTITPIDAFSPTEVPTTGVPAGKWTSITAGTFTACGVRQDQSLWCWGDDRWGEVGNGSVTGAVRIPISAGGLTVKSVDGGDLTTCAVTTDGRLFCWGRNDGGELGSSVLGTFPLMLQVDSDADWAQVSIGYDRACGLKTNGSLLCWGFDGDGQLGNNMSIPIAPPFQVGTDTWKQVVVGAEVCATKMDGSLWCWGNNGYGTLGIGDVPNAPLPTQVGTSTGWGPISLTEAHTCGIQTNGQSQGILYCWGNNANGQLGDGTHTTRNVPTPVVDTNGTVNTDWTAVGAGDNHTCGIRGGGQLYCWGWNDHDALGLGITASTDVTVATQVGTAMGWTSVVAGRSYTCATRTDGSAWCWGYGGDGQVATVTYSQVEASIPR